MEMLLKPKSPELDASTGPLRVTSCPAVSVTSLKPPEATRLPPSPVVIEPLVAVMEMLLKLKKLKNPALDTSTGPLRVTSCPAVSVTSLKPPEATRLPPSPVVIEPPASIVTPKSESTGASKVTFCPAVSVTLPKVAVRLALEPVVIEPPASMVIPKNPKSESTSPSKVTSWSALRITSKNVCTSCRLIDLPATVRLSRGCVEPTESAKVTSPAVEVTVSRASTDRLEKTN